MSAHQRTLSLFDATMLVMGGIIGVGVFYKPHEVAGIVPEPGAFSPSGWSEHSPE